jgi:hypothetical protein
MIWSLCDTILHCTIILVVVPVMPVLYLDLVRHHPISLPYSLVSPLSMSHLLRMCCRYSCVFTILTSLVVILTSPTNIVVVCLSLVVVPTPPRLRSPVEKILLRSQHPSCPMPPDLVIISPRCHPDLTHYCPHILQPHCRLLGFVFHGCILVLVMIALPWPHLPSYVPPGPNLVVVCPIVSLFPSHPHHPDLTCHCSHLPNLTVVHPSHTIIRATPMPYSALPSHPPSTSPSSTTLSSPPPLRLPIRNGTW